MLAIYQPLPSRCKDTDAPLPQHWAAVALEAYLSDDIILLYRVMILFKRELSGCPGCFTVQ